MPTQSEIATIRARTEQYKRGVEFNASMSPDMVKEKLEETFPYLKNKGKDKLLDIAFCRSEILYLLGYSS